MVTVTSSWAQAAMTKSREALPQLQRALDVARAHRDDLRARLAAVQRAAAVLDPDADLDTAAIFAGEAVDLIDAVVPAGELVRRISAEAEARLRGGTAVLA